MQAIHVVRTVGDEANGLSYPIVRLCESLIDIGVDTAVAAVQEPFARVHREYVESFPLGFGPRRLGVSPGLRRWLEARVASRECDVIHNHGLWTMPNVYAGRVYRRHRQCKAVVSPHGMLSGWALEHHAVRKRVFWRLLQEDVLRDAACFHATCLSEYEDIRRLGFTQPISVFSHGIDVPRLQRPPLTHRQRMLFLGRIHPSKGIDILLRAWSALHCHFSQWELHIAGPDQGGYLAVMKALAAKLNVQRVVFCGPLYGRDKLRAYREATLLVLPTRSENFGTVVAEAMAAGTPVIVTVAAPWKDLVTHHAGWWIEVGVDPLIQCLQDALTVSPDRLLQMGLAAREWMIRDYSWRVAGEQCLATYRWLIYGGDVPSCVRVH